MEELYICLLSLGVDYHYCLVEVLHCGAIDGRNYLLGGICGWWFKIDLKPEGEKYSLRAHVSQVVPQTSTEMERPR